MPISHFLKQAKKFDIQLYAKPEKDADLTETHIPFSGSPLRHPYDKEKVILVADPFSTNTFYYEFWQEDITYAEELPSLVNMDGVSIVISRLWIKKKSVGMRCTPFIVEDIRPGKRAG